MGNAGYCNVCGCSEHEFLLTVRGCDVHRCLRCGLVFVAPLPSAEYLAGIYNREYFTGESGFGYPPEESYLDRDERLNLFHGRLAKIEAVLGGQGRLLDVGCATGYCLRAARERGWEVLGVDISEFAAQYAASQYGLRVVAGRLQDLECPDGHFDAVTMWDLLEHVLDPTGELLRANRVLRPGGVLALSTPCADTPNPNIGPDDPKRAFWQANPPEHLYYFLFANMNMLLTNTGFAVESMETFAPGDPRFGAMEAVARKAL